jgi:hypothetical protein
LEVVEPLQSLADHPIQLAQVAPALWVGLIDVGLLDAAEQSVRDRVGIEAELAQRPGRDRRGNKATHRLLGATVGVVDQIGQCIEHRHGQTRSDLHGQRRRSGAAGRGEAQLEPRLVGAELARLGDLFLDAVGVDPVLAPHGIRVAVTARLDGQARRTRVLGRDQPVHPQLGVGRHAQRPVLALARPSVDDDPGQL